jgi:hypothetical protein
MFIEHSQPPEPPDWPAPVTPDGECAIDCNEPSLPVDLRAGPIDAPAQPVADRGRRANSGRRRIGE